MNNRKKFLPLFVFMLIIGVGILLFGLITAKMLNNSIITGFCSGFGIVMLSSAITRIANCLTLKDEDAKKIEIELKDERNTQIREKAAWRTGNIIIPVMGISALALALTDNFIGAVVISGILLIYSVCIIIFSRYYSKKL